MAGRGIAELGVVAERDDDDRGAEIRRRLDAIGISDREWHARTGIDRKTLNRAIANDERLRVSTRQAIDDWLDRIERENAGPVDNPEDDLIEVEVSDSSGVRRAIVRGPVRDREQLTAMVARLIREMRSDER
jgi:hypothetical protein